MSRGGYQAWSEEARTVTSRIGPRTAPLHEVGVDRMMSDRSVVTARLPLQAPSADLRRADALPDGFACRCKSGKMPEQFDIKHRQQKIEGP